VRMTDYNRNHICGINCRELQGDATDPFTIASLREALDNAHPVRVCIYNQTRTRIGFWNCLSMHPVYQDDELRYFVACQVRLEASVHRSLAKLERRSLATIRQTRQSRQTSQPLSPSSPRPPTVSVKPEPQQLLVVDSTPTMESVMAGDAQGPAAAEEAHKAPPAQVQRSESSLCAIL